MEKTQWDPEPQVKDHWLIQLPVGSGGHYSCCRGCVNSPLAQAPFQLEQIHPDQTRCLDLLLVNLWAVLSVTDAGSPVALLHLLGVVKKGIVNV